MSRFLYASYVSEDPAASVRVLEAVGFVPIWNGTHPSLGVDGVLCAARRGGLMVLGSGGSHPALVAVDGSRERMVHLALAEPNEAARERFLASEAVGSLSDPYQGPAGETRLVGLTVPSGGRLWVEFAADVVIGHPGAEIARIESTPMVAPSLADFRAAFAGLDDDIAHGLGETVFPTLGARSEIILLENWHFLEFNEPTGDGVIRNFLDRMERPGPFGVSVQPVDMDEFIARAEQHGIATNTSEPIVLPVVVDGRQLDSDAIVTMSPTTTGGARIFVVDPLDYPWKLL